ncbi:Arylamine N-acetyltransferase 2 [Leucoagaricus sp. SymC.cos]|nr:Arylamine N-acetyltransferase 2 [Leucoagaricus sp. SymC.cos]
MSRPYPLNGTLRDGLWIKPVQSKYTSEQVAKWLSIIDQDKFYDIGSVSSETFPVDLENLERLSLLHLLAFPFENTTMHYTAEHDMDVSTGGIYNRFINERNGSYCFGHNTLMLEMLRGLGYRAYLVAVRVNHGQAGKPLIHSSFTHLVILVQPSANDNRTYVVDVGYGSSCLMRPILLSADSDNFAAGLNGTERHRLTFSPREETSLSSSPDFSVDAGGQWNLDVGHKRLIGGTMQEIWRRQFSFTEAEIWEPDILSQSFVVSKRPLETNHFWNNVMCLKLYTVDEGNTRVERTKRPMYRIIIHGREVRKSFGAESEVLRTFETESDRIRALREILGLDVKDEDHIHINGRVPAFGALST